MYIIMPVIAIITCIFVGYFIKPKTVIEEAQLEGKPFTVKLFTVIGCLTIYALKFALIDLAIKSLGNDIQCAEAGIVSCMSVILAGIS